MRFGFHVSISGGFARVVERARKVNCETMQLFTRSPRSWQHRELDPDDVARFRADLAGSGVTPVFVHAPYLPNLATVDATQRNWTIDALVTDMKRCEALGIRFLITHVGRAGETGADAALARVADNIDRVLGRAPAGPTLLLENTAGMGTEVGYRFEQLAAIIDAVESRDRVGVVLDTAHLFEAGYELRTADGLDATLREFDAAVGFGRLHLLHLNDSKTGFGSRVDRHWHIGEGEIGVDGFRLLVNHPLLAHLPGIMETPRKDEKDDLRNLATIRRLLN